MKCSDVDHKQPLEISLFDEKYTENIMMPNARRGSFDLQTFKMISSSWKINSQMLSVSYVRRRTYSVTSKVDLKSFVVCINLAVDGR